MLGYAGRDTALLFSGHALRDLCEGCMANLRNEIDRLEANRLLNTSPADLVDYFVYKYTLSAPRLKREEWSVKEDEVKVDVRHDRRRFVDDRSRPALVPGQRIEIEVPVEGQIDLLYARASSYSSCPPRAIIKGSSLFLNFEIPNDSASRDIKNEAEAILSEIERYLQWTISDLEGYNQKIASVAENAISARRQRLLANQGRVASLGIPLKEREGAPKTYAVPEVKRKVVPTIPPATSAAYEPEPVLDMNNYEHILSVIQNMALVMERSPSAFKTMGEEGIRQHFLVQLNGQFEGAATGETFNVNGKTDILLRSNGKNVFIAECKFWKGPKHYRETIDQLLGYTAWRDTKTAILVFNRGTDMSKVLGGIESEIAIHKNFKRKIEWKHESGFRSIFHHNGDTNREFMLTVLVFDVPGPGETGVRPRPAA